MNVPIDERLRGAIVGRRLSVLAGLLRGFVATRAGGCLKWSLTAKYGCLVQPLSSQNLNLCAWSVSVSILCWLQLRGKCFLMKI